LLLCVFHVTINIVWHRLNTAPPTWDSAGHLTLSFILKDRFTYLFKGELSPVVILQTSSYYPPLIHILGSGVIAIFGRHYEYPILLGTAFFIMAIIYLFKLVNHYFKDDKLAFFTVLIFSFFPQIWEQSRHFHLDIPLLAFLLASFYHLTNSDVLKKPGHTLAFFLYFSLAQLTKWYGFVYLVVPFVFEVVIRLVRTKDYFNVQRIVNIAFGVLMVVVVAFPWYVINYKTILETTRISSTADAGDPALVLSYESFIHYLKIMTSHQIGILSVLLFLLSLKYIKRDKDLFLYVWYLFLLPYITFTLIQNKDLRYILPLVPLFAFCIAYMFLHLSKKLYVFLGLGFFLLYLVVLYVFLGFNQFQKLEGNYKIFGTLFAGPYRDAWITSPWDYSYNPTNWRGEEIIKRIQSLADDEGLSYDHYKVLEVSDNRFYSIASFDLYKVQNSFHNLDLVVPYFRFDPFTTEELSDYLVPIQFAVVPSYPGPPGLRNIAVLNQLVSYFNSDQNKDFIKLEDFSMPDGNVLSLYQRRTSDISVEGEPPSDSLILKINNILVIDREGLGGDSFDVELYSDAGEVEKIHFGPEGSAQKRIALSGIKEIKILLPPDKIFVAYSYGWRKQGSSIYRTFDRAKNISSFALLNSKLISVASVPSGVPNFPLNIAYKDTTIDIELKDTSQSSYVAWASEGWVWSGVELNNLKTKISIPMEGLIQLETTSPGQKIEGFPENWGIFPCYSGKAVCMVPLIEDL